MLKKIFNTLLIGIFGLFTCGCNQYFISDNSEDTNNKDIYYGAYNRRDLTWADVVLYKKGSDKKCEGVIHLNAPSRSITIKNDRVDAIMKLACTDGTLMSIDWELKKKAFADGFGKGIDQYNNTYNFKTVSKDEFQTIAEDNEIEIPNKEFLLKY